MMGLRPGRFYHARPDALRPVPHVRLGVIPENLIERLALKSNAVPEPLAETQFAYSMARSIMAGVKLGVFQAGQPLPTKLSGVFPLRRVPMTCLTSAAHMAISRPHSAENIPACNR